MASDNTNNTVFWEPVLAMNGKRVAWKGMRTQAKEVVRKRKREVKRKAK